MSKSSNFQLESSIAYQVYVLARALRKDFFRISSSNSFGLFPEQWFALYFIFKHPGQTQSELAARAFEDRSSLSRTLGSLQKKGLVESSRDDIDRRAIRYQLSDQGHTLYQHIACCMNEERQRVFADLEAGEIERFKTTAAKLLNNLG